jgi:hypothetical protein
VTGFMFPHTHPLPIQATGSHTIRLSRPLRMSLGKPLTELVINQHDILTVFGVLCSCMSRPTLQPTLLCMKLDCFGALCGVEC